MTNKNKPTKKCTVTFQIDSDLKEEHTALLDSLGQTMSGFIRICLTRLQKDGNANFVQDEGIRYRPNTGGIKK